MTTLVRPVNLRYVYNIVRVAISRAQDRELAYLEPVPIERWPGFELLPTADPGAIPVGRPEQVVARLQEADWFTTQQEED